MIENIIELLKLQEHYGSSEVVEIAKGKYEYPDTFTKIKKQFKRWLKR